MEIKRTSYSVIKDDYENALRWMESIGVVLSTGRTKHYQCILEYWNDSYTTATERDARNIFPDFIGSISEIYDFVDIYKNLKNVPVSELTGIAKKLQKGVNGPLDSALENSNTVEARNFIFEALVAAKMHYPEGNINTIFSSETDTGIYVGKRSIWIECKRVTSERKLEANIRKASNQLGQQLKRKYTSGNRGIVALDYSKILHIGDKIYVKQSEKELTDSILKITEIFVAQYSELFEKAYKEKSKKIIGTLVRYATMASAEDSKLIVRASDWGLVPRKNGRFFDKDLLLNITKAIHQKGI